MNIKMVGFDVQRSGSNVGVALGSGLYVIPTLEKALNYAKRMPCQGAITEFSICACHWDRQCCRDCQ
jgi:hypothetical protein